MAEKEYKTVVSGFCCGDCGSEEWHLAIVHHKDGRTLLSFKCANEECVEKKKQLVDAGEDDLICWDELDITGQGYDPEDIDKKSSFLPHIN